MEPADREEEQAPVAVELADPEEEQAGRVAAEERDRVVAVVALVGRAAEE